MKSWKDKYIDLSLLRGSPLELQYNFAASEEPASGYPYDRAAPWQKYSKFNFYLYGRYTGNSILQTDHNNRMIFWCTFYPLERAQNADRRGLGTIAHVKSVLGVAERAKPDYIVSHSKTTQLRDKHLQAMGLAKRESLGAYLKKSLKYASLKGFSFKNPFQEAS